MADKEYIEKQAAIELLRDNINLPIDSGTARAYWTRVVEIKNALIGHIAKIPAADVVEVVRCENCKNCAMVIDLIGDPHLFCELSKNKAEVQFGDFCSYGERKEQK